MRLTGKTYHLLAIILLLLIQHQGWGQHPLQQSHLQSNTSIPSALIDSAGDVPFVVNEIHISGNKKTKNYIIARELPFKSGDTVNLPDLVKRFELGRQQLMNTRLFNEAVIALKSFQGYKVDITVEVKERWYIFPIPYFKPIDRNLAEWAKQGYDLKRLNYGFKLNWNNFTGRNDKLRMWLITGYTKQIQFAYEQPYADKSLKHGFGINMMYAKLKELNHTTFNNEQQFFPHDSIKNIYEGVFMNEVAGFGVSYFYRPAIRTRHAVRAGIYYNKIDSAVLEANPKYFANNRTKIVYPELSYTMEYFNVDYIPYPLKGFMMDVQLLHKGAGKDMNLTQLNVKANKSVDLGKKFYYSAQANGTIKLPFEQPFFNHRLMGYGDFYLRGLEKYVIDGVAAAMFRQTFRKELFTFNIRGVTKSKSHNNIPFRIYAKTYGDIGYVHNKSFRANSLTNKMLYTAGAGLDVVTIYDFVFRFEYSLNQLGQKGVFLHLRNDF